MTKELWVNLPVRDVAAAAEFFRRIGFALNDRFSNENMSCVVVGEKKNSVILVSEATFRNFTHGETLDARGGAEVLISFDAASREEVDETARKVAEAGGAIFSPPAETDGWMYGFGFSDLDGHRWNMLHMDFSRAPQQ